MCEQITSASTTSFPRKRESRAARCCTGALDPRFRACEEIPSSSFRARGLAREPGNHMWTAPASQGLGSCNGSGRLRSYVRPPAFARAGFCGAVGLTAGPDGLRGSGPKQERDVEAPTVSSGCPDPRIDRSPSCCRCPCSLQVCQVSVAGGLRPAVDAGRFRRSPSWPRRCGPSCWPTRLPPASLACAPAIPRATARRGPFWPAG